MIDRIVPVHQRAAPEAFSADIDTRALQGKRTCNIDRQYTARQTVPRLTSQAFGRNVIVFRDSYQLYLTAHIIIFFYFVEQRNLIAGYTFNAVEFIVSGVSST
ncbi:MAG: hypothetical protein DYG98_27255 [Haliscomenobacteraceae bacterium CHB4]|nr:hypothetical protein [Haliscomenobacteraceae bacterium CHB4]